MELASMLAGEPFSDHPASVCPVIASFLRTYNDTIDDHRRQNLYACAAAVVGTRSSKAVQEARAARLVEWAAQRRERRLPRSLLPRRLRGIGLRRMPALDAVGALAVRSIAKHTDETHREVLALVSELIAIGAQAERLEPPAAPEPAAVPVRTASASGPSG
jgi:hypothetical protein